jgi:Ca2+-binding EF-hand superfamily protein
MVDKTDTGIIPKSELGKIVRALGYNPSEAEIAKVQVTVDPEGSHTSLRTCMRYIPISIH